MKSELASKILADFNKGGQLTKSRTQIRQARRDGYFIGLGRVKQQLGILARLLPSIIITTSKVDSDNKLHHGIPYENQLRCFLTSFIHSVSLPRAVRPKLSWRSGALSWHERGIKMTLHAESASIANCIRRHSHT